MEQSLTNVASGRINLTDFQRQLHAMSTKQAARPVTKGAFGGVTKDERYYRRAIRRGGK